MDATVLLQQIVNGISLGAVYALIAVGFGLVFNVLKFSNFAHGGVLGFGAYAGFLVASRLGFSLIPTILFATLVGGVVAIIVELIAFRHIRKQNGERIYFFVTSVTMLILLEQILVIFFGASFDVYPRMLSQRTFDVVGVNISVLYILMMLSSIVAFGLLAWILKNTKIGIGIRAASMDLVTTSLMGANVDLIVSATFFVSGMLGGLAGVLVGMSYSLYPQIGQIVVKGFIASVLGGLGNLTGVAMGAMALGIIEVFLVATIGAGLSPAIIFLIMLVFLIVRPQGFAGVSAAEKA